MGTLKGHDFFAGIAWNDLFLQDAPDFIRPTPPSAEDEALDWELTSIITQSEGFRGPIVYQKNPHSEHVGSDDSDDD